MKGIESGESDDEEEEEEVLDEDGSVKGDGDVEEVMEDDEE